MAETIHLEIVTPDRLLLQVDAESIQVPALDGEIGILPGHSPLISQLMPAGLLSYVADGVTNQLSISVGFVEVMPDRVRIMAEFAEHPEEIDVPRTIAAKEKAERELARASTDPTIDASQAALELERSSIRLQIASKKK